MNNSKFVNRRIDFLNIDLEGADMDALRSLNFSIYRPRIICIEISDQVIEQSEIFKFLNNLNWDKKFN